MERKPVPSLPGITVSEDGTVYNTNGKAMSVHVLKPKKYLRAAIWIDGKCYWRLVHRLVAEAFHGPCPEGMECRHLNGDHTDNRAENLRWGTRAENVADGPSATPRKPVRRLAPDEVREIRRLSEEGWSQQKLAEKYDVRKQAVYYVLSGRSHKNVI